jgi:hypothetical protein
MNSYAPGTNSFSMSGTIIINQTPIVGGTNGYVLYDNNGVVGLEAGGGGGLTVGTTTITSGTSGYLLYDNAGILGEIPSTVLIPAPSNLTWYVATTGSDSNPGTALLPFLSIQHAVIVAAGYDWQFLYFPTINVADGTYTVSLSFLYLPPLVHLPAVTFGQIIGNTTTPSNVVVHNTQVGGDLFYSFGEGALWYVNGFQTDCTAVAFSADYSGGILVGNLIFADSASSGNMVPYQCLQGGFFQDDGSTFALTASTISAFAIGNNYGTMVLSGAYTLPAALAITNAFFSSTSWTSIGFEGTFTSTMATGAGTLINTESQVIFPGAPSTVPGGSIQIDPTSAFQDSTLTNSFARYFATQEAGPPTAAADLNPGAWGVFKDNTQAAGLGITIKYNDAGTLYNVGASGGGGGGPPLIIF